MAHIDAKTGSPGAIDNASGSVVLLLLTELLSSYPRERAIEIVAMNGEDNYGAPGEQPYLRANPTGFDDLALSINLDGLGYREGGDAYLLYNCPPSLAAEVAAAPLPPSPNGNPARSGNRATTASGSLATVPCWPSPPSAPWNWCLVTLTPPETRPTWWTPPGWPPPPGPYDLFLRHLDTKGRDWPA